MSWEDIQRNTFKRWLNNQLKHTDIQVGDLAEDLEDGLVLINVVEKLAGRKMGKYNKTANFRVKKLENVSIALKFLEDDEGVSLVNMDAMDIVDGNIKLILGLVWTLILHYSIAKANYGDVKDEHVLQTPKQRLMGWIGDRLPHLKVTNFKEDWQNGKAVGALVESVAPGLLPEWEDWNTDNPEEVKNNVEEALEVAETWLGVPQLLTAEEILNPEVDELSVMTYVAEFTKAKLKEGAPLKQVTSKVKEISCRRKAQVYDDDFPEKHFRGLWEICEIMINS